MSARLPASFVPARQGCAAGSFECGLCGHRFSHGEQVCASCAFGDCDLVRCPRCGYQFPRASRLVDVWSRLMSRRAGRS